MRSSRGIYEQDEGVSLDLAILWSAVLFSRLDRASDNLFPQVCRSNLHRSNTFDTRNHILLTDFNPHRRVD